MTDAFRNPTDLKGYWRTLYARLISVSVCETCDTATRDREALEILNAIRQAMDSLDPISGCIHTATHVMLSLTGVSGAKTDSGEVTGAQMFYVFSSTRTWFEVTTHCFTMVLVAWWKRKIWAFGAKIRHQAVMIMSRCKPDWADPTNPVIDLALFSRGVLFAQPIWRSYGDWVEDSSLIGKDSGLVSDGF